MRRLNFASAKEIGYDGVKLQRYLSDECFKLEEGVDIYERHGVTAPSLEIDGVIIGKALYTSTVEEINQEQRESSKQLWLDSDQSVRNEINRTVSGLYRFFVPAYRTLYFDKYGYPDEEKAMKHFTAQRASRSHNNKLLASYIRKHPFTWQEAFISDSESCIYDSIKLNQRLQILEVKNHPQPRTYERGDLIWETVDEKVKFNKNPNGRFYIAWHPDTDENVTFRGDTPIPVNVNRMILGVDPYDHDTVRFGTGSMGAGAMYRKYDPLDTLHSDNFVMMYLGRPEKSKIFYEDMLKACFYYGAQMAYEDSKPGIGHHFEDRGYHHFLFRDDKGDHGIPGSPKTHRTIVEETEAFIVDNCHRVMFEKMITDWLEFRLKETTKYDMAMATGYALIGATRMKRKAKRLEQHQTTVSKYYRTYKVREKTI